MTRRNWLEILPLVLLVLAIGLSPSFPAGEFKDTEGVMKTIELRIEDFLMVILGLIWLASFLIFRKEENRKPPLLFPILAWVGIGLFSTAINLILSTLSFSQGFFYFFKEVQYFFLFFYLFYHIKSVNSAKLVIKLWIFLGVLNISYVLYQISTRTKTGTIYQMITRTANPSNYGPAAIGEEGAFTTGAFFLLIFIFLFNIFLYYFRNLNISIFKKSILGAAIMSPAVGVFSSASRTVFLGFGLALFLTLFFWFLKEKNLKLLLTGGFILIIIVTIVFIFLLNTVPRVARLAKTLTPESVFSGFMESRWDNAIKPDFLETINKMSPFSFIFGLGKGYVREAHNQYLRNFAETGIIGSILFLILVFVIMKKSFKGFLKSQDNFSIGLTAGLLIATLTMLFCSIATEPFIMVKPSEVYWVFAAITMAILAIKKKEKYDEQRFSFNHRSLPE